MTVADHVLTAIGKEYSQDSCSQQIHSGIPEIFSGIGRYKKLKTRRCVSYRICSVNDNSNEYKSSLFGYKQKNAVIFPKFGLSQVFIYRKQIPFVGTQILKAH